MKKIALGLCLLAFLSSCKKDSTTTNPNTSTSGFTWTENGGAVLSADSAYFASSYNTIMAWKGGAAKHFEINLSGGTAATYTVGSGNAVTLITSGSMYTASAGSLTITSNAGGKMSGSFTTTGSGASLTAVNGTFTDMQVR